MAQRRFRGIARVAGLVFQGYPGRRKTWGQVQASSSLLFNVFQRYDSGNLLIRAVDPRGPRTTARIQATLTKSEPNGRLTLAFDRNRAADAAGLSNPGQPPADPDQLRETRRSGSTDAAEDGKGCR